MSGLFLTVTRSHSDCLALPNKQVRRMSAKLNERLERSRAIHVVTYAHHTFSTRRQLERGNSMARAKLPIVFVWLKTRLQRCKN